MKATNRSIILLTQPLQATYSDVEHLNKSGSFSTVAADCARISADSHPFLPGTDFTQLLLLQCQKPDAGKTGWNA